jgi:integrase
LKNTMENCLRQSVIKRQSEYLKELAQLVPCLHANVSVTYTKGGKKITEQFKKWELVTTHTARRSFATNMYLMKVPTLSIMAVTGHKTEKAFMKYIKLANDEHAILMHSILNPSYNLKAV